MKLTVDFDREADGRWIADVTNLAGVMAYGESREDALMRVKTLALERLADMAAHGELLLDDDIVFEPEEAA